MSGSCSLDRRQLPVDPNQSRSIRSQMQITRSHLNGELQISPDRATVLRLLPTPRLGDQIPKRLNILLCHELLLFHEI